MRGRLPLLVALILATLVRGPLARGEDDYSQERCSLCHIRQSVFFSPGFASSEALKSFGEERVCYSCHNGTVRDSRDVLWRGAQHPAAAGGDKAAGGKCSRCHSPHGKGGWGVLAGTSVSLRRGGDAVCTGCHGGYTRASGLIHRTRFPEGGCRECHRAHGGTGKALLREARGTLCLRCHPGADSGGSGGHPVARAESGPPGRPAFPDCLACHPVHRKETPGATVESRCAGCHVFGEGVKAIRGARHPDEGKCTACHSFHAKTAEGGKGLRGADMHADTLCGSCHARQFAETRTVGRRKGTHPTRSVDGTTDVCFRCHRIHKGARGTPLLVTAKSYSCLVCHGSQNTISEIAGIVLAHPVFERVGTGRLADVVKTRRLTLGPAGEIVCRTCHAVHGASPETPLLAPGLAGDGNCLWCHERMAGRNHVSPAKATAGPGCGTCHPVHGRRAQDSVDPWAATCTVCHTRTSSHGSGRLGGASSRKGDMPAFDRRGRKVRAGDISCPTCHEPHGVARDARLRHSYASSAFVCTACHGDKESVALTPHDLRGIAGKSICEPCHLPHGGNGPGMSGLAAGAEGNEARCRACHREKGMGRPLSQGGHPVNILVARPIPEMFPLYGPGGEKMRNGAVTCATCHEVHGTSPVPRGQGTGMLLRTDGWQAATDIGRIRACVPCHEGKLTTHGQADCIWCHPPHEGKGVGPDCRGCHPVSVKGVAAKHGGDKQRCDACHRIHGPNHGSPRGNACLGCHPKNGRIVGTPHGKKEGGPCGTCHPAHEAIEDKPLKRHGWEEIFAPDLLCLRCHRAEGDGRPIAQGEHPKSRKKVPTSYGAVVTLETPIKMFGRVQEGGVPLFPLFDDTGGKSLSGRMGCLTCHDPHAGNKMEGGAAGGAAGRYLRDPSGVFLAEVCSPCHRESTGEHARKFHELPRKTD